LSDTRNPILPGRLPRDQRIDLFTTLHDLFHRGHDGQPLINHFEPSEDFSPVVFLKAARRKRNIALPDQHKQSAKRSRRIQVIVQRSLELVASRGKGVSGFGIAARLQLRRLQMEYEILDSIERRFRVFESFERKINCLRYRTETSKYQ
jgi:hypothetical protein